MYSKMAEISRKVYNSSKLKLTTAKEQLTKALKRFEEACQVLNLEGQDVNLKHVSKVRMAETVMGTLSKLSEKMEEVKKARDIYVTSIIDYDEDAFDGVSKTKTKDVLIQESVDDSEGYEDKAEASLKKNDDAVRLAESVLEELVTPQGQPGDSLNESQWSAFKPQLNLAPSLLDTGASHLEVMKYTEALDVHHNGVQRSGSKVRGLEVHSTLYEQFMVG